MIDTFIMRGEWIKNIQTLPVEMQDKILAEIVRYGTKQPTMYDDDPVIFSIVNGYKSSIDNTSAAYEQKVCASKTAGRKKKIDDRRIYELAREGKTAAEVAEEMGVSKSSVDKSEGWKNRGVPDF
jgi:hypothetical protein